MQTTHTVTLYDAMPKNPNFAPSKLASLPYATPFLLMDLDVITKRFQAFTEAMPNVRVHYAMKANPHPQILRHLHGLGCRFEIASYPELEQLIGLGVSPSDVLFSNPVKIPAHIHAAHKAGLDRFAFSSIGELQKIAAEAPRSRVYVRLAVSSSIQSDIPSEGKFGVPAAEAAELLLAAKKLGLIPYGITFHVGSQMTQTVAWEYALRQTAQVMQAGALRGMRIQMVDIGGGYPAFHAADLPSIEEFGRAITHALHMELPYMPAEIVTEPGRGLVSDAGVMVTTVLDVIDRNSTKWVYTDLGGFTMMESLQTNYTWQFPLADSRQSKARMASTISAATCDSADIIMRDQSRQLSADLQMGDRIFIYTAGAYTTVYASDFNGFARPHVHYVS